MTRISFHQKLETFRERLLQMAGVAEQTLRLALDAHCRGELSACAKVRLNEAIINRSEREIDQMALDILAMEQPMAVDLRFVLAAIKINSDLERVGDQSMTIALLAEELAGSQPCDFPVDIPRMAELSMTMVRKALQALTERDAELATSVLAMDDAVDEMNRRAKGVLAGVHRAAIQVQPALPSTCCLFPAAWNASPITPPTWRKMSSSGCVEQMFATATFCKYSKPKGREPSSLAAAGQLASEPGSRPNPTTAGGC